MTMAWDATPIDAEGDEVEGGSPGHVPDGVIGAVVEGPGGRFIAVPVLEGRYIDPYPVGDGNLGVYSTFGLAVAAVVGNHRRPWTREERRRTAGWW